MKRYILITGFLTIVGTDTLYAGANAGITQEVLSNKIVQLNGSQSTLEKHGRFVRFNWKQIDGPKVILSNKRSVKPTFIAPNIDKDTVLTFNLTTKELFRKKRTKKRKILKTSDYINIIVIGNNIDMTSIKIDTNSSFITHEGFHYLPIKSPKTGRIWLDRNLGARRACLSSNDVSCFGNLYQWGRNSDGHQIRTSSIRQVGAIDITSNSTQFVTSTEDGSYFYVGDWAFGDNNGLKRSKNWSKLDGSSICPIDYRVPTINELSDELTNDSMNQYSFLNLPKAGFRNDYFGSLIDRENLYLWSSTTKLSSDLASAFIVSFDKFRQSGVIDFTPRASGYSIRCIKQK